MSFRHPHFECRLDKVTSCGSLATECGHQIRIYKGLHRVNDSEGVDRLILSFWDHHAAENLPASEVKTEITISSEYQIFLCSLTVLDGTNMFSCENQSYSIFAIWSTLPLLCVSHCLLSYRIINGFTVLILSQWDIHVQGPYHISHN